jgi:hypothetical protein
VLDSLLLRLHTGSMIDVAVMLALSRRMSRLRCFMESWLARSVVLKTADTAFDLDELLDFLFKTANNEEHRYSPFLYRLSHLRPASEENTGFIRENRYTDVEVDQARVFYRFLDLQWTGGWSLKDGLRHIQESFPEQRDIVEAYCSYRSSQSLLPL